MYLTISDRFLESLRDTYFHGGSKGSDSKGHLGIDSIVYGDRSLRLNSEGEPVVADLVPVIEDGTEEGIPLKGRTLVIADAGSRTSIPTSDYDFEVMYVTQSQIMVNLTLNKGSTLDNAGNIVFLSDDGTSSGAIMFAAWFNSPRSKGVGSSVSIEMSMDLLSSGKRDITYTETPGPSPGSDTINRIPSEGGIKGEIESLERQRGQSNVAVVDFYGEEYPTVVFRESGFMDYPAVDGQKGTPRGWKIGRNSYVGANVLDSDSLMDDLLSGTEVGIPVKIEDGEFVRAVSSDRNIVGVLDSHGVLTRSGEIFYLPGNYAFTASVGNPLRLDSSGALLNVSGTNVSSSVSVGDDVLGYVLDTKRALIQIPNRGSDGTGPLGPKGEKGEPGKGSPTSGTKGVAGDTGPEGEPSTVSGEKGRKGQKGVSAF